MHGKPYATVTMTSFGLRVVFDEPHGYPSALVARALHHAQLATLYLSRFFGVMDRDFFERSTSQALNWLLLHSDVWNDPRLSDEEEHDAALKITTDLLDDFLRETLETPSPSNEENSS